MILNIYKTLIIILLKNTHILMLINAVERGKGLFHEQVFVKTKRTIG